MPSQRLISKKNPRTGIPITIRRAHKNFPPPTRRTFTKIPPPPTKLLQHRCSTLLRLSPAGPGVSAVAVHWHTPQRRWRGLALFRFHAVEEVRKAAAGFESPRLPNRLAHVHASGFSGRPRHGFRGGFARVLGASLLHRVVVAFVVRGIVAVSIGTGRVLPCMQRGVCSFFDASLTTFMDDMIVAEEGFTF